MISHEDRFSAKLLSAFVSIAMAASLVSAPGIAWAVGPEGASDAPAQDASAQEASADAAADGGADGAQVSDGVSDSAQADRVYESVDLTQNAAANDASSSDASVPAAGAQGASAASDPEDVEMTHAELALSSGAAQTVISYNGLNYVVNEDGETVALAGLATKAPAGDVSIPNRIVSGGKTYAVTNICTMRGGVFANC